MTDGAVRVTIIRIILPDIWSGCSSIFREYSVAKHRTTCRVGEGEVVIGYGFGYGVDPPPITCSIIIKCTIDDTRTTCSFGVLYAFAFGVGYGVDPPPNSSRVIIKCTIDDTRTTCSVGVGVVEEAEGEDYGVDPPPRLVALLL